MPTGRATYNDIYEYVLQRYGYKVGGNCISEAKEKARLPVRMASNRLDPNKRSTPCDDVYVDAIHEALRHFGVI